MHETNNISGAHAPTLAPPHSLQPVHAVLPAALVPSAVPYPSAAVSVNAVKRDRCAVATVVMWPQHMRAAVHAPFAAFSGPFAALAGPLPALGQSKHHQARRRRRRRWRRPYQLQPPSVCAPLEPEPEHTWAHGSSDGSSLLHASSRTHHPCPGCLSGLGSLHQR